VKPADPLSGTHRAVFNEKLQNFLDYGERDRRTLEAIQQLFAEGALALDAAKALATVPARSKPLAIALACGALYRYGIQQLVAVVNANPPNG
jgi:hypothetical protein